MGLVPIPPPPRVTTEEQMKRAYIAGAITFEQFDYALDCWFSGESIIQERCPGLARYLPVPGGLNPPTSYQLPA